MKRGKSRLLRMLVFFGLAAGLLWARDWWERRESRVADAVEAFAREGLDEMAVAVYAIDSLQNEMLADRNLEFGEFYARVSAEHFHQYPIRKSGGVVERGGVSVS